MNNLFQKAKTFVLDIGTYWNKPREGEYVSNKEFLNFVIGASGSNVAAYAGGNLSFTAGCLFVGAVYGLKMMDFAMLGFVNLIVGYLFSPINMIITDNLGRPPKKTMRTINLASLAFLIAGIAFFFVPQKHFEGFMPALPQVVGSKFIIQAVTAYWNIFVLRVLSPKFGKYRSWILADTVPYVLSLCLLVWFPYNTLEYHEKFWVMHLFFSLWTLFAPAFAQINNVQNVISSNTNERTRIMSIGSFLYSLLPSVFNMVFPIAAAKIGGMTDIKTYRYIVPAFVIASIPLTLFFVFGVKDRVVQEQEHKPQIDMKKGFKEVLRNKYLWITNISGWIGTFAAGSINIVNMLIIYSMRQDWVIGIMATILGTAWTPGMLLAPIIIKKFGKKKIMLISKYTSVLCSLLSVAGVYLNSFVIIIISTYISTMFTSVVGIVSNSMTADIWDYQQYISGERLDGCMGIFAYLSAPITTVSALIIPTLYKSVGFTSDWNILYDNDIRNRVFIITIVAGVVTGLLATIPYHFYDFTEEHHEQIMEELRNQIQSESENEYSEECETVSEPVVSDEDSSKEFLTE